MQSQRNRSAGFREIIFVLSEHTTVHPKDLSAQTKAAYSKNYLLELGIFCRLAKQLFQYETLKFVYLPNY